MRIDEDDLRYGYAAAAAFCAVTAAWVAWAFATPGDFFANGNAFLEVSLVATAGLGLLVGLRLPSSYRFALLGLTLICIGYWVFVPDGWWASEPRPTSGKIVWLVNQ